MGWKNWLSWVKGGVIGLFIGILTLISFSDLIKDVNYPKNSNQIQVISELGSTALLGYITIIVWIFLFVFVGIIISWIYGKIKQRKEARK